MNSTLASATSRPSNFECIYILNLRQKRQKRIIIVERQTKIPKWRRKGVSRQSKKRGEEKAEDHRHLRAIPSEANLCNCFHARQGQGFRDSEYIPVHKYRDIYMRKLEFKMSLLRNQWSKMGKEEIFYCFIFFLLLIWISITVDDIRFSLTVLMYPRERKINRM